MALPRAAPTAEQVSSATQPAATVYINWRHFESLDEMAFVALAKYFDDIWYAGADDIDIFDDTLSWVLSVRHDGEVRALKLR